MDEETPHEPSQHARCGPGELGLIGAEELAERERACAWAADMSLQADAEYVEQHGRQMPCV